MTYPSNMSMVHANHLGNILTTVSDQKLFDTIGAAAHTQGHYVAQAVTVSDYYPFGHQITDRSTRDKHRYAFNGKEQDTQGEWGSSTTAYDYGFRIYHPGVGRFLSVDPLAGEYPFYTPYQFAGNMPIMSTDVDGLEPIESISYEMVNGKKSYAHNISSDWIVVEASKLDKGTNANVIGERMRMKSIQTGTGYGLGVASAYHRSTYTESIGQFALGSIGGSLLLTAGTAVGVVNSGTYLSSIFEFSASYFVNGDLSAVDVADIGIASTGVGFLGELALGSIVDFSPSNGFQNLFDGTKTINSFRNDLIFGGLGLGVSKGLNKLGNAIEEGAESQASFLMNQYSKNTAQFGNTLITSNGLNRASVTQFTKPNLEKFDQLGKAGRKLQSISEETGQGLGTLLQKYGSGDK